jgi:hypothetical protein
MANTHSVNKYLEIHSLQLKEQLSGDSKLSSILSQMHKRLALIEALLLSNESKMSTQKEEDSKKEDLHHEKIPFPNQDGIEFISPKEIIHCRANGNYTDIILTDGRVLLQSITLKEIQSRLPERQFIRVHKTHLVNRRNIKKYYRSDGHYLVLDTEEKIPIARLRLKPFLKKMKLMIWVAILSICTLAGQSSWSEIVSQKMPEDLRMSCMLWQLGEYSKTQPEAALTKAISKHMTARPDGRINAEIVFGKNSKMEIDRSFLEGLGIHVGTFWRNRANVWLTVDALIPTAQKLPEPYSLEAVLPPGLANEGPGLMHSQDFIDNGADGAGIRVAVIDLGFEMLSAAQTAGAAPPATRYNHTTGSVEDVTQHGTACLETVFDHAPGATYYVHRVKSLTDLGQAVDQAIDNNVNIISTSVGWYNTGWSDNSGPACEAIGEATDAGMLVFESAGNDHGSHWQGTLQDADGDDWHQWAGGDETNEFTVGNGGEVRMSLQWSDDPDPIHDDYNLYLYRVSNNSVLESSTSSWSYELLSWTNNTGGDLDVYVAVKQDGDHNNPFEVFNYGSGTNFEYHSTNGSTASPANSTAANCISVGAVERPDYNDPPGSTGVLASYSSRGPTNGGNLVPDLVGPTETTSFAYGGFWGGTSCSTPNVAGMAAAFWSEHNYLSAAGVRLVLFRQAQIYNDWGDAGNDYLYGRGGAALFRWINNSRFIYHGGGNIAGVSSLPYYNIEQADASAPANYTMIFLGESIPAPPAASAVIDKQMLYISAVKDTEIEN